MQTNLPLTRLQRFGLLLIVALGCGLRFGGLNHDLHEGQIYHPDTPKQIRAVERFLDGNYYFHVGNLDYDIYPYFNSHLVEYLCRAGDALHGGLQALTGAPVTTWRPDYYQLFWIMRAWNALLATLLILVVFQLARENWDHRAAWAAALLFAVSPADVVACHFAGADTTAGFLATLTVFFALRIYRLGRARDYICAALCAACGFSSKYHAGMVLLPVLAAHGWRAGAWRALAGRRALGRLALLVLTGLGATLLTTPILLTHFTETVQNIFRFFFQISSYRGVDESIRHGGWGAKLAFAMHRNLPILVWILGPLTCFGAVLGLKEVCRRRPEPRAVILYALPLFYFLVGVSLRPMAHPIYHTLMTPLVFVAAAVVFTRPFGRPENDHPAFAGLRLTVVALSVLLLLHLSIKEVFLFWHQDASRLALAWTEENVPPQFAVETERYSFTSDKFAAASNAVGSMQAVTAPQPPPPPYQRLKTFSLETDRMPVFRNIPIRLYARPADWLQPGFRMPVFQRWPSASGNRLICDEGPEFLRSEKLLALEPDETPTVRWLVSRAPLAEAWLAIRNGNQDNLVALTFGGVRHTARLKAGEVAWWRVPAPRPSWPREPGHDWYRWTAQSCYGRARVLLATRPEEIGPFLFNAGRDADALPLLMSAAAATRNPALAAMALRAAARAGLTIPPARRAALERLAAPLPTVHDDDSLRAVFGISAHYLDALDFLTLEAENLQLTGNRRIADLDASGGCAMEKVADTAVMTNPPLFFMTPWLQLDPGVYTLNLRVRGSEKTSTPTPWRVIVRSPLGATLADTTIALPPLDDRRYTTASATLLLSAASWPEVRIFLEPQSPVGVVLDQITLRPDVLATVQALARDGPPPAALGPAGVQDGGFNQAVDTLFDGGLRLISLRCSAATVQRGQALGLDLEFRLEQPGLKLDNLAVFIHGTDAAGLTAFQGDFGLTDLLQRHAPRGEVPRGFNTALSVPAGVRPGAYILRVGVCRLDTTDRLRIRASPWPQKNKAVLLPQPIRVTEY